MPLSDAQRRVGRQGVAAARDAGHLNDDAATPDQPFAKHAHLASELVAQSREVLSLSNADIAERTSLTVSQLEELDRGRHPVSLDDLMSMLIDQLHLRVVLEPETADAPTSPVPDDPPPVSTSADLDEAPAIAIRLPYPDD